VFTETSFIACEFLLTANDLLSAAPVRHFEFLTKYDTLLDVAAIEIYIPTTKTIALISAGHIGNANRKDVAALEKLLEARGD
jgi:hypothetical protein